MLTNHFPRTQLLYAVTFLSVVAAALVVAAFERRDPGKFYFSWSRPKPDPVKIGAALKGAGINLAISSITESGDGDYWIVQLKGFVSRRGVTAQVHKTDFAVSTISSVSPSVRPPRIIE